jgi:hypothetical protein
MGYPPIICPMLAVSFLFFLSSFFIVSSFSLCVLFSLRLSSFPPSLLSTFSAHLSLFSFCVTHFGYFCTFLIFKLFPSPFFYFMSLFVYCFCLLYFYRSLPFLLQSITCSRKPLIILTFPSSLYLVSFLTLLRFIFSYPIFCSLRSPSISAHVFTIFINFTHFISLLQSFCFLLSQFLQCYAISLHAFKTLVSTSRNIFHFFLLSTLISSCFAKHRRLRERTKNSDKKVNNFNCMKYIKTNNPRAVSTVTTFRHVIRVNVYNDSKLRISFDDNITVWVMVKELYLSHTNRINPPPLAATKDVNISSRFSH